MEIIPINFGLKYRPPKLGLEYHIKDQPAAHFLHEFSLSFVTKYSDVDDVTDELFERHNEFLNPRVISHQQVRRLVDRLIKQLGQADKSSASTAAKIMEPEIPKKVNAPNVQVFEIPHPSSSSSNQQQRKVSGQSSSDQESKKSQNIVVNHPAEASEQEDKDPEIHHSNNEEDEEEDEEDGFGDNAIDQLLEGGNNQSINHQSSVNMLDDDGSQLGGGAINFPKDQQQMSQTLRNLSGTFKEAKAAIANGKIEELSALHDDFEDDFGLDSARQNQNHEQPQPKSPELHQNNPNYGNEDEGEEIDSQQQDPQSVEKILDDQSGNPESSVGVVAQQEDEDVIDIDNPEDLAAKGLKRIQIEGEEEEYLMDQEGNIYDLRGNFIGTTDDDGNNAIGGDGGMVSSQVGADQHQQLIDDEDVDFGEY